MGDPAAGISLVPRPWRLLVYDAAFVGIAECTVAGGIVADYRVIDSWKGPGPGATLRISRTLSVWEPTFPIALCGERYLILASASAGEPYKLCLSRAVGCGQPLWWRRIPAHYTTTLDAMPILLNRGDGGAPRLPGLAPDLVSFADSVRSFLSLPPDAQESLCLRARVLEELARTYDRRSAKGDSALQADRRRVDALAVDGLISFVAAVGQRRPRDRKILGIALGAAGGDHVLRFLRSSEGRTLFPGDTTSPGHPLWTLKLRRGETEPEMLDQDLRPSPPPDSALEGLRAGLRAPYSSKAFETSFRTLTLYEPGTVEDFLMHYEVPDTSVFQEDTEYVLGCYFGWRCGADRAAHFRRLLRAKDPFVRVAAAVYLSFEDRREGEAALRRLTREAGPSGAWAAIELARRGVKDEMMRAIQIFAEHLDSTVGTLYIRNMRRQLLVLLSNSARASGVEPPPGREAEVAWSASSATDYALWWQRVNDRITLRDPWEEILERQKAD
jgi:hypothetical protein